jgi:hypothetical protein
MSAPLMVSYDIGVQFSVFLVQPLLEDSVDVVDAIVKV